MTEMKSTCPSVAHCALTVAPSCSTSLLTSVMRCGLFFTVCTPSGVRVESMMYVGMVAPPSDFADVLPAGSVESALLVVCSGSRLSVGDRPFVQHVEYPPLGRVGWPLLSCTPKPTGARVSGFFVV